MGYLLDSLLESIRPAIKMSVFSVFSRFVSICFSIFHIITAQRKITKKMIQDFPDSRLAIILATPWTGNNFWA